LFDKTGLLVKLDQDQSAFLDILNPLNVQVRYPEYRERILKTLSNERAKEILLKTEELFEWLKRELLKKQGSM
jgi:HEPN domain-containing protein